MSALPPVADSERLARFVLSSKWFRPSDGTVKQDAFIPFPYPNLSVTRHTGLTEAEIWAIGQAVAEIRPATLYGRADIDAGQFTKRSLRTTPTSTPKNHVNISGWPADKPAQKIIAAELAAAATFIPRIAN